MSDKLIQKKELMINVCYIFFVVALGIGAVWSASIILPFWIALLIATILQPVIRVFNKKFGLKKGLSAIVLFLFYLLIGGTLVSIIVEIVYLVKDFFNEFPKYFNDTIKPGLANIENILMYIPEPFRPLAGHIDIMGVIQNTVASFSEQGIKLVTGFVDSISSGFVGILITFMLSYFVVVQYDEVVGFLKNQLPERFSEYAGSLKSLLKNSVLKYCKAVGILMVITFGELCVGFLIIGVESPIAMAACIALLDALPVFGTGAVMIPWILFELMEANYSMALAILILYGIVLLVRNLLEPKILGDQLELNPIVALVAIYAGFKVFGILGMIAFPIIVYILLALHKDGKLRLYKESKLTKTE